MEPTVSFCNGGQAFEVHTGNFYLKGKRERGTLRQSSRLPISMVKNSQKIVSRCHRYCLLPRVFASPTEKLVAFQESKSVFDAQQ